MVANSALAFPVLADSGLTPLCALAPYSMSFEDSETEHSWSMSVSRETASSVKPGSYVYFDGTSFGGRVDIAGTTSSGKRFYKGRTLLGLLDSWVLCPPYGVSHLTVSGSIHECAERVLRASGASVLFSYKPLSGVSATLASYDVPRYVTALAALECVARQAGCVLAVSCEHNGFTVSCRPIQTVTVTGGEISVQKDFAPVNHLVALGQGEGAAREVIHYYANTSGEVSEVKTITGKDEHVAVYERTDLTGEQLKHAASAYLHSMQDGATAADIDEATIPASLTLGDRVQAVSKDKQTAATSTVVRVCASWSRAAGLRTSTDIGDNQPTDKTITDTP